MAEKKVSPVVARAKAGLKKKTVKKEDILKYGTKEEVQFLKEFKKGFYMKGGGKTLQMKVGKKSPCSKCKAGKHAPKAGPVTGKGAI